MSTYTCLCGASSITLTPSKDGQIRCHCTDCQLTSGTAFSSNIFAKSADTKFDGKIGRFTSKAASGNDVTHIFCTGCGTPFAHDSDAFGDQLAVQTGPLKFKDVPYVAELFVKDRWTGIEPVSGADQKETA
ncbi:hypothetical protein JCM8097_002021 [Rhodosporidiobolus ruineniae]